MANLLRGDSHYRSPEYPADCIIPQIKRLLLFLNEQKHNEKMVTEKKIEIHVFIMLNADSATSATTI